MSDSYAKIHEAAGVTRHRGTVLVTLSFLAGLGLGLLLMDGSDRQFANQGRAITMAQQFMQGTRMQTIIARPIAAQSFRHVTGPIAASVSEDAHEVVGRREALAAGAGAAFSIASRPVFAAEAAAPVIAPFPVKGDPQQSIEKIARLITHSFGSGKVTEKTPTSLKANLYTSERVYSAELGYGEKLTVGEQKMQHIWKDKVEFTYNPGTNVIDVALKDFPRLSSDAAKIPSSKPGYGTKIVEEFRQEYIGDKSILAPRAVGQLFGGANPTAKTNTPGTRQMRTPKEGTILPKGFS